MTRADRIAQGYAYTVIALGLLLAIATVVSSIAHIEWY